MFITLKAAIRHWRVLQSISDNPIFTGRLNSNEMLNWINTFYVRGSSRQPKLHAWGNSEKIIFAESFQPFGSLSFLYPFPSFTTWRLKQTALWLCLLFCMVLKLRLSHYEDMNCASSTVGCWARYLGIKKGSKRNVELIMRSFMICMFEQILHLLEWRNYGGWDTQRKRHAWRKREMHTGCWRGNQKYRNHLKVLGLNWRIILNYSLKVVWDRVDWIHLAQDRDMDEIL